ncbi:hypothetical protein [Actinomadura sp. 6N118]|uniref:hypothetical protein n=1 Tax=Actinomadura sp. 6N118 TaxID=3375151 RepID=UPI0037AEC5F3
MPAKTGVPDGTRRTMPQPDGARTPAEFVTSMRKLQLWSGLSMEELEARVRDPGSVLVPGGLAALLSGDLLPREETLGAFLVACGCVPEVRARWLEAHARLSAVRSAPPSPDVEPGDVRVAGPVSKARPRPTDTRPMIARPVIARPPAAHPVQERPQPAQGHPMQKPPQPAQEHPARKPPQPTSEHPMQEPPQSTPEHPMQRSSGERRASAERRIGREPRVAGRHRSTGELPVVAAPARAGRHRASGEFPVVARRRRAPISPQAATVSLITAAAVVFALVNSADGEGREAGKASRTQRAKTALPPKDGLYMLSPVTGEPTVNCLSIMNDDALRPTLSQHVCDQEDQTEHFRLESLPKGGHVLKGQAAPNEKPRCVTLDGGQDRARLHLKQCFPGDERQRFTFEPIAPPPVNGTAIFRMLPALTHANGMCVGVDPAKPGTVHAVHTSCFRAGVQGFTFTPVRGS